MPRIEPLGSPRILAGVAGEISVSVYSDGALPATADITLASVAVVDAAGTTVTMGAVADVDGIITAQLPAASNDRPKRLTATWTFTLGGTVYNVTTYHETVGELLFTEAEARAYDGAAMASEATYPDTALLRMRDQVQDSFESIIGVALGRRNAREVFDGHGLADIGLRHTEVTALIAAGVRTPGSQAFTPFTVSEIADAIVTRGGRIRRETLGHLETGYGNIVLEYEHGLQPIPHDLRQAALRVTRNNLVRSGISDRTISTSNEFGSERLAIADSTKGWWYGIPAVDAVLSHYRSRYYIPAFG